MEPEQEDQYSREPMTLARTLRAMKSRPDWIVLDEIQKVPKLLNVVHLLIEEEKQKFILTGSSARKLRRGAANLLAGRAFVYSLFPLTTDELGESFLEDFYFRWGGLPKIYSLDSDEDRKNYLRSYGLTYLKEEIKEEQLVRRIDPFRDFLEIAAQMSNRIVNYSKMGADIGVEHKTVQCYFDILVDTWIGFYLRPFHQSVRKSQLKSPKFYFFDIGVRKSLSRNTGNFSGPGTSSFGEDFEQFIVTEIFRGNEYVQADFRLSFLQTKNDNEIDLILSRGRDHIACEIKSSDRLDARDIKRVQTLAEDIKNCRAIYYISRDRKRQKIDQVHCLHWRDFITDFRLGKL
ncbi:MAG: ATPase [Bdellovibrio sp.]|nr:MAG: ATPase [Bdellovibrio sp.]